MYVMLRVKAEDIEKVEDGSNINYEIINTPRYPIDYDAYIENYEVNDNFLYSVSNGKSTVDKGERTKLFITDMNTGAIRLIYSRIKDPESVYIPQLFCNDNYVFLYEYSYIAGEDKQRITRFDKDGKNQMLVMDYTGKAVIKPADPVQ